MDLFVWWLQDPRTFGPTCWFLGLILGIGIGRGTKTRKLEIRAEQAEYRKREIERAAEIFGVKLSKAGLKE